MPDEKYTLVLIIEYLYCGNLKTVSWWDYLWLNYHNLSPIDKIGGLGSYLIVR